MTLKEAIFKAGKTQYWLEQQTGISQSLISLFANGYRRPNPAQLKLIVTAFAKELGVEIRGGIAYPKPKADDE